MATKKTRPTSLHVLLELVRSEGQDDAILTAVATLRKDLTRRLERIEQKLDAFSLNQETVDRLAAHLKASTDRLESDVHSSTP